METKLHRSQQRHPLASSKTRVPFSGGHTELFEVLGQYELTEQPAIARGTFGFVVKARDVTEDIPDDFDPDDGFEPPGTVAIKKVRGLFDHPRLWLSAVRELKMLRFFDHENVIRAKDVFIPLGEHDNLTATAVESRRKLFDEVYIVMDYLDYTLSQFIASRPSVEAKSPLIGREGDLSSRHFATPDWGELHPVDAAWRAHVLHCILEGIGYLHGCGVIHRDLKPDNVLVGCDTRVKVCDFGQGRGGLVGDTAIDQSEIGQVTQWYCSPEHLRFNAVVDTAQGTQAQLDAETFHAIDVWSIGCIAAEMLIGKPLFDCRSPGGTFQMEAILNVLGKPSEEEAAALIKHNPHGMDAALRDSRVQHANRLEEVLRSAMALPHLDDEGVPDAPSQDDIDAEVALIMGMLRLDPAKRITIDEALKSPFFANQERSGVQPKPFPVIDKQRLSDPQEARKDIWELFLEAHPVVGELLSALKHDENAARSNANSPPPADAGAAGAEQQQQSASQ